MQPGSSLKRLPVIGIRAVVRQRRIKLIEEIPVGAVDFHAVKTGSLRPQSR